MSQQKSLQDYRIDACESAAQAYMYSSAPGAGFYARQASNAARSAMRSKTVAQAKRYAESAATFCTRARLIAAQIPTPRKSHVQVMQEAEDLYR